MFGIMESVGCVCYHVFKIKIQTQLSGDTISPHPPRVQEIPTHGHTNHFPKLLSFDFYFECRVIDKVQ